MNNSVKVAIRMDNGSKALLLAPKEMPINEIDQTARYEYPQAKTVLVEVCCERQLVDQIAA